MSNLNRNSLNTNLEDFKSRIFSNTTWDETSDGIKKMALLQGLPITIYSYAAGLYRSNNKYNLFGLIDFFTYISRLNILSSINIRPDITFTFLNEENIINSYIATYRNGLLGSALNIFMNPIDNNNMDKIIDNNSNFLTTNTSDSSYDISYDIISKITNNSLASPKYFIVSSITNKVKLNHTLLKKYKSIIYGGIDYEQIAVILDHINTYSNIEYSGPDSFKNSKAIFYYYIETNLEKFYSIANSDNNNTNLLNSALINAKENSNNTWTAPNSNNINYNDIIYYYLKDNLPENKYSYNYGQITFFRSHDKIKQIILPSFTKNNENIELTNDFLTSSNNINWNIIYDSMYDLSKNENEIKPLYTIILMPIELGNLDNGKLGKISNQLIVEKSIRKNGGLYSLNNLINELSQTQSQSETQSQTQTQTQSQSQTYNLNINTFTIDNSINFNFTTFYTIICGMDDYLSYEYLNNIRTYDQISSRIYADQANIIKNTYLCYYDGNGSSFKKILTNSNNSSTPNIFNNIKKITNLNSYNSLDNNNRPNIFKKIVDFVYNINEGKAINETIPNTNQLSYTSGLALGIDTVILIYLTQLETQDNNRIFDSDKIFKNYLKYLNKNEDFLKSIKKNVNFSKINNLTHILSGRYSYYNNSTNIIDNSTNIIYNSIHDLSFNKKEEFFLEISQFLKREINTNEQKSNYKILEFYNNTYINNEQLETVDINSQIKNDINNIESKWYDITYQLTNDFSHLYNLNYKSSNSIISKIIQNKNIINATMNINFENNSIVANNSTYFKDLALRIHNTNYLYTTSINESDIITKLNSSTLDINYNNVLFKGSESNYSNFLEDFTLINILKNNILNSEDTSNNQDYYDANFIDNLYLYYLKLKLLFVLDSNDYYALNNELDSIYNIDNSFIINANNFNFSKYETNSTFVCVLYIDNVNISNGKIIPYDNSNNIRGLSTSIKIPDNPAFENYRNTYQFHLMLYGNNTSGESDLIKFKYYSDNSSNNYLIDLNYLYTYETDKSIGNAIKPIIFNNSIENIEIYKLDKKKYYNYTNYDTTNNLLNFSIVDILTPKIANYKNIYNIITPFKDENLITNINNFNIFSFEFNSTFTCILYINNLNIESGKIIACDVSNNIRGVNTSSQVPNNNAFGIYKNTYQFSFLIYSNNENELIKFKYYNNNSNNNYFLDISYTYSFIIDDSIGNATNPVIFNIVDEANLLNKIYNYPEAINIIKLLKFIFNYNNHKINDNHNINKFINYIMTLKSNILNDINNASKEELFGTKLINNDNIFITNLFSIIESLNSINIKELDNFNNILNITNYENKFITINDSYRAKILNDYNKLY